MKKLKTICSAIAALTMLALAGCDLEMSDSEKVSFFQSKFDTSIQLPQTLKKAGIDMSIPAMTEFRKNDGTAWKKEDGVSFSFFLSNYTKDWSMIFQVESGNFGTTTAHQCENKVWQKNAFGCSDGNGVWDEFLKDCYVTISISADGLMKFYKDGALVTTYGGSTAPYGFNTCEFTIGAGEWVKNILNDIATNGVYCIHPSDSWANAGASGYTMAKFSLDVAVDDAGALAKYNAYKAGN